MNDIPEIPFIQGNRAWYFLSVFYVRENWMELVTQINRFYQDRSDTFSACLISFSDDKGEKIEISFASSPGRENMKNEIDRFFLSYIEKSPSVSKTIFPYGRAVWSNYPNNTLLWLRFRAVNPSDQYLHLHQATFRFALSLIENDTSPDTLFSVCLYLITKYLSCIEPENREAILSQALYNTSTDFKVYSHIDSVKNMIEERIDLQEMCLTIESYWNENPPELSPELKAWLMTIKGLIDDYDFVRFCYFVCRMFGLNGFHQLLLLELINIWYKSDPVRIENE